MLSHLDFPFLFFFIIIIVIIIIYLFICGNLGGIFTAKRSPWIGTPKLDTPQGMNFDLTNKSRHPARYAKQHLIEFRSTMWAKVVHCNRNKLFFASTRVGGNTAIPADLGISLILAPILSPILLPEKRDGKSAVSGLYLLELSPDGAHL